MKRARSRSRKEPQLKFATHFDSNELIELPLSMLMQTVFFGGYKGSGKTTAMKKAYEAAYDAGAQCVGIAPLGKWWSLRIAKNGHGRGLPGVVIFGGGYGDVPIQASSGRTIARIVHTKRLNSVLDVELMRKEDRAAFLADFFEELMILRKSAKGTHGAMVVLIDETQSVAPQLSNGTEVARLRAVLGDFARECRNFGCGLVMSAQRSASVDKEMISLCEMLIVMRTVHHLDREVYRKWVDEHGSKGDDEEESGTWLRRLRRLGKGEGYLYVPEQNVFERIRVLMPRTYDATKTATIGARVAKVGRLGKLDVKRLSAELSALVEQATAEDPKVLKAKIRELETKLAAKSVMVVSGTIVGTAKPAPKLDKRTLRRIERAAKDGRKVMHRLEKLIGPTLQSALEKLRASHNAFRDGAVALDVREKLPARVQPGRLASGPQLQNLPKVGTVVRAVVAGGKIEKAAAVTSAGDPDAKGPRAILTAIAQHASGATREALTIITGYKRSTRDAYVLRLIQAGYASEFGEAVVATDAGIVALGSTFKPLPTGVALRDHWLRTLPKGESAVLAPLFAAYPKGLSRDEITNATGYKVSTRNAYVLRLLARQLVNETDVVRASDTLFQEQP